MVISRFLGGAVFIGREERWLSSVAVLEV